MRSLLASLFVAGLAAGQDPMIGNAMFPTVTNVFAHEGALYAFALVPAGGPNNPLVRFVEPQGGIRAVRAQVVGIVFFESRPCAALLPNQPRLVHCGDMDEFVWNVVAQNPSIEMRGPTIEYMPACQQLASENHYLTYATTSTSSPCGGATGPQFSAVLMRIVFQ